MWLIVHSPLAQSMLGSPFLMSCRRNRLRGHWNLMSPSSSLQGGKKPSFPIRSIRTLTLPTSWHWAGSVYTCSHPRHSRGHVPNSILRRRGHGLHSGAMRSGPLSSVRPHTADSGGQEGLLADQRWPLVCLLADRGPFPHLTDGNTEVLLKLYIASTQTEGCEFPGARGAEMVGTPRSQAQSLPTSTLLVTYPLRGDLHAGDSIWVLRASKSSGIRA